MKKILIFIFIATVFVLLSLFTIRMTKPISMPKNNKIKIIATLFPLYDFTKNIVKEKADVFLLLPPGIEPHGYEPKFSDIMKINKADILIYTNKYMEPWLEDLLKGINNKELLIIDSSKGINFKKKDIPNKLGHNNNRVDPHIWLNLSYNKIILDNILDSIIRKDPKNKTFYTNNARKYKEQIDSLDNEFKKVLEKKRRDTIVFTGHSAFIYLASRYNFKYIGTQSFSPDSEPSAKQVSKLIKFIKNNGIKYIYYEELLDPKLAITISKETNAKLLILNAAHNISKSDFDSPISFISIMKKNLYNIKLGLECH